MTFKYLDLTSGRLPDLKGKKLEAFEEALLNQVKQEVEDCEDYLEDSIRPKITENWEYYNQFLPRAVPGESSYVDNTCQATVEHYVAVCMDAFTSGDSLEVVPDGVTNPMTLKVINQVMNDVLDNENSRHSLYQSFFRDAMVSSASAMRPIIREETKIDKEFFTDVEQEVIQMRQMQLELEHKYDEVEVVITEKKTVTIQMDEPVPDGGSFLGQMDIQGISTTLEVSSYTGYFTLLYKEKTIKVEPVLAENFLIDKDAHGIHDARIVGHKTMITISDMLKLGIDYDKVLEVYEGISSDDAESNTASMSRKQGLINDYDNDADLLDNSQREVELYELYIKSSAEETVSTNKEIAVSKLYQVFYCESVLLSYQEVDEVPYCGSSPIPRPHMFWGDGMVDRTKAVQRAKTGLIRQTFVYNEMASRPRFEYNPEQLHNVRDIFNTQPGAGIAVKQSGTINPIQMTAMTGNSSDLLAMLDVVRENGTGMSFTGQGMMGDVLKAGASTQSAAMVLSEAQMVQKSVIQTLLNNAIIPLIQNIYHMLRENFNEWDITVDGQKMTINPNDWPELSSVRIKTPLGTSARLEQSQKYGNLAQVLAGAQPGTELAKLVTPEGIKQLMTKSYELMDVPDASFYMADDQTIAQKDQMTQALQAMQTQLQQMQVQMAQLTQQNTVLQQTASQMAQQELAIKQQEQNRKDRQTDAELQQMADDQIRKETMDEATMESMADKNALAERVEDRKELETEYEIRTGNNLFNGN